MNKEASRRVLDMLAGWSMYVDTTASETTIPQTERDKLNAEIDIISNLYQQFGADDSLYRDEAYINDFIINKILPFVLKGT